MVMNDLNDSASWAQALRFYELLSVMDDMNDYESRA